MRINVYSQELTNEIQVEEKTSNTGLVYTGVRIMLHSSDRLHQPPMDDDRTGITFWLPKSTARRFQLADAFRRMADAVIQARPETGLY